MEKNIFLFIVCLTSILATPLPMVSPDQRYAKIKNGRKIIKIFLWQLNTTSRSVLNVLLLTLWDRPMFQLSFAWFRTSQGQREHSKNSILISLVRIGNWLTKLFQWCRRSSWDEINHFMNQLIVSIFIVDASQLVNLASSITLSCLINSQRLGELIEKDFNYKKLSFAKLFNSVRSQEIGNLNMFQMSYRGAKYIFEKRKDREFRLCMFLASFWCF